MKKSELKQQVDAAIQACLEKKAEELKERDPVRHRAGALVAAAADMRDRIDAVGLGPLVA